MKNKTLTKILLVSLFIFLFNLNLFAKTKIQSIVQRGGLVIKTSPTVSYNTIQTYPNSTVTVYIAGTTTLATIYSDDAGTPKANPFTAGSDASFTFYVDDGIYDIKFSGTGITTPFTIPDVLVSSISVATTTTTGTSILSYPASDIANPITISATDPRVNSYTNPSAPPYNAKCDGTTDDTIALRAALTATPSGGGFLIPNGPCILTSTAGTPILPFSKTVNFFGMGPKSALVFKTGTATSVNMLELTPPVSDVLVDFGNPTEGNNVGSTFQNFSIYSQTAGQGGDGIKLNISSSTVWLGYTNIDTVRFYNIGGKSVRIANDNGAGSPNNINGSLGVRIKNCFIYDGITAKYASDSLHVENNLFRGLTGETAFDLTFIAGAANARVLNNVIVSDGGGIFRNGTGIIFANNYAENLNAGAAGIGGAFINFLGDAAQINGAVLYGNIISVLSNAAMDNLKFGNIQNAFVRDNFAFSVTAGRYAFITTASTVGLNYEKNIFSPISIHASTSISRGMYTATVPIRIPDYSGVDRFQTNEFTLNPFTLVQIGTVFGTTNGIVVYCSDCNHGSNPCTSGGTGAIAKRLNSAWVCN